jgi:hypothetical protein
MSHAMTRGIAQLTFQWIPIPSILRFHVSYRRLNGTPTFDHGLQSARDASALA